jgi:hypothetical protein
MKNFLHGFLRRGLVAFGFGPVIVAIIYLSLAHGHLIDTVTAKEMCTAIFSSAALAFIAGGTNAIYQIERLPLTVAILIHCVVLYISYLYVYLLNGWLKWGVFPISFFTVIFVLGYILIWIIIYITSCVRTRKINERLAKKRLNKDEQFNH